MRNKIKASINWNKFNENDQDDRKESANCSIKTKPKTLAKFIGREKKKTTIMRAS